MKMYVFYLKNSIVTIYCDSFKEFTYMVECYIGRKIVAQFHKSDIQDIAQVVKGEIVEVD